MMDKEDLMVGDRVERITEPLNDRDGPPKGTCGTVTDTIIGKDFWGDKIPIKWDNWYHGWKDEMNLPRSGWSLTRDEIKKIQIRKVLKRRVNNEQ